MNAHLSPALSRRDLIKGGALVVGFAAAAPLTAALAPPAAAATPDPALLDSWIAVHADNTATIFFGKVELGQGTTTGMLQIAGEELDLAMSQLKAARVDTDVTPNQGPAVASLSIMNNGPQLRAAAAEARRALLRLAAAKLGVPAEQLRVSRGIVSVAGEPQRAVSYGALIGDRRFDVKLTDNVPQKPVADYSLVGTRVARVDVPDKVAGTYTYMQHMRLPDMLHGRIVRPRGQGAYGAGAKIAAVDPASIADIPGAKVLRKGDFLGVVAEREWDAVRAAARLKVTWDVPPRLPAEGKLFDAMRASRSTDLAIVEAGDVPAALAKAAHVRSATYYGPYQGHAPFAPSCALADVGADSAVVMCSTQFPHGVRAMPATTLGLPADRVRVQYYEGAGVFGARLSRRFRARRRDPVATRRAAGAGAIHALGRARLGQFRPGASRRRARRLRRRRPFDGLRISRLAPRLGDARDLAGTGAGDTAVTAAERGRAGRQQDDALRRLRHAQCPSHQPSRTGARRLSQGRQSALALGSVDLFCVRTDHRRTRSRARHGSGGVPPPQHVDPRWIGVMEAVVKASAWMPRPAGPGGAGAAGSRSAGGRIATGRGIGIGTHTVSYGAAVADIEVDKQSGEVRVKHLYGALDAGLVVNPALVENQISGMLVQAASRAIIEEVQFTQTNVTSLDWKSYPVLRFADSPDVTPIVVQRMNERSTGAGEEVMGAAVAAIANAFFDATGVRMRQYPLTPERVRAALRA